MSIRARGGLQVLGFLPEFNAATAPAAGAFYGPSVGGIIEFQSQFVPGFGVRVDGGYIPIGVRVENPGLRDADHKQSSGYYVGGGIAGRILPGFEVELTYRLLSTTSTYVEGSVPPSGWAAIAIPDPAAGQVGRRDADHRPARDRPALHQSESGVLPSISRACHGWTRRSD